MFIFSVERQRSIEVLKEKFELLVKNQFFQRCVSSENPIDPSSEKLDFSMPDLNVQHLYRVAAGAKGNPGDSKIYWRVNFDRFTQDLR